MTECQIFINDLLLRHITDHILEQFKFFFDGMSIKKDLSGTFLIKTTDCIHQCCLSCTGTTDDRYKFITLYVEIYMVQKDFILVDHLTDIFCHQMHTLYLRAVIQDSFDKDQLNIQDLDHVSITKDFTLSDQFSIYRSSIFAFVVCQIISVTLVFYVCMGL